MNGPSILNLKTISIGILVRDLSFCRDLSARNLSLDAGTIMIKAVINEIDSL